MNKTCYRIVFNKARGLLMAVAETVTGVGKTKGETIANTGIADSPHAGSLMAEVCPLIFSVWAILGVVLPESVHAQIIADPSAPGNQRPTVFTAPNNTPLVNIQTPSAAGVSRNAYGQFDVQQQGAILNNSRTNVQTQLGGWVQGNPWLAGGSARVILNEVHSNNASLLRGYVEVAGQRAQVVIANPAGVTCDGCGFINANRATVTTGTPVVNGGSLEGYRVHGGTVTITGNGLDASTADYTDLIARAVQVRSGVWANQLKVLAGANQVTVDQASSEPSAASTLAGIGAAPALAIDVALLGGMYAGKISLVSTEAGVGVSNAGKLYAGVGEVVVTADGRFDNAGQVTSATHAHIDSERGIKNSGTVYAQGNAVLSTRGNIDNSGTIAAMGDTTLVATGASSQITSTSAAVLGAGVQTDGSLGASGHLIAQATQAVTALGQNLSGGDQDLRAQTINLAGSQTSARSLVATASSGDINFADATVVTSQTLTATTSQTLRSDQANISASQINIGAHDLSNVRGHIVQTGSGDLTLNLPGTFDNTQGRIATNSTNLNVTAASLTNTDGKLEHAGTGALTIVAPVLSGARGQISSNGLIDLTATSTILDAASTTARQLNIHSDTLSNRGGTLIQTGSGLATIAALTQLDNTSGTIAGNGHTLFTVGTLANQGGTIQAAGPSASNLTINATGSIDSSNAGKIQASGNTTIISDSLNNTQGQVTAGQTLNIVTTQAIRNSQGVLAANNQVALVASHLDNRAGTIGSIQSGVTLTADTGTLDNSAGRIEAAQDVSVSTIGVTNTDGTIIGTSLLVNSNTQTLDNTRGQLIVTGTDAADSLDLQTGALNNDGGLIQAKAALTVNTHGHTITNTHGGILASSAQAALTGSTLNNQGGQIQAAGNIGVTLSGELDNTASLVRSGQTLTVNASRITNTNTQAADQGLEAKSVNLGANDIDNSQGAIRANNEVTLSSSGSVGNSQGLISAGNTLKVQDLGATKTLAVTNTGGTLIAGQNLALDSRSLSGDGALLSQGDMAVKLTQSYVQTGQFIAKGTASLETTGTLTNQATLQAGTALRLKAATIDNQTSGIISGQQVNLQATDSHTLTNRGLIDGTDTIIETVTLNNLGTGRIYGDHVAIGATTVTNDAENGAAPVIAARNRLDIGADTIYNREHALIFSAGDLAIGGSLDANKRATGSATTLNNASATIEALGSVDINARQINNTNEHFSTTLETLPTQRFTEYQGSGSPNRYTPGTPDVYVYNDESVHLHTPEGNFESWTSYNYTRNTTETRVGSSDPSQILSGGAMRLTANTLNNDKSRIIAGGALTGTITALNNTEVAGERTITDTGSVTSYWRNHDKGRDSTGSSSTDYTPPVTIQSISLTPTVYQQNTAPSGTGTQISALSTATVSQTPSAASGASSAITGGQVITPITQVTALSGSSASGIATVVRSGGVNTSVPNNRLYGVSPNLSAHYLVETDPAFANYRNWLSSDYLLNALSIDPATTQKRLGDGFYEQKLIREQVAQLTGRRFLDSYANDEAQYQALLNNAATYAKAYALIPGVALSATQMAQLTSDIVWLVEKDVTLPDGTMTKALVPQLYVRVQDGDLQAGGALIAGNSVNLTVTGDLTNSGTIAGRTVVALTAENIQNLGGRITGQDVGLAARNDLNNIAGTLAATNSLIASAGNDLNVISTTRSQSNSQGSRTNIDRVAGLYVTGSGGTLMAQAGRDINLSAAAILNAANSTASTPSGSTVLAAGHNLNLTTVTESASNRVVWDSNNQRSDASRTDVGTAIQTQGDLTLQAGNDLNARAANIVSNQGALLASAGNSVNLTAGQTNVQLDEAHQHKGRSSIFSSTTTTTRDTLDATTALGTTLSGKTVTVLANQDIHVQGGNIVSDSGTLLLAKNNINIEAVTNTTVETHFKDEKKSGIFSGGGLSISIGTQQQSVDQKGTTTTAAASTVGSAQGNVVLSTGQTYTQTGSDVLAPAGDITITAKKVDILEARETSHNQTETQFKQSGLTVAVTSPVITAIQTAQQMSQAASNTSDTRMQVLAAANVALSARTAVNAVKAGQGSNIKGLDNQIPTKFDENGKAIDGRDARADEKVGGINLSISLGSSSSQSQTTQSSDSARGSTVAAGNNVNITASGAGADSDITLQGANVKAGHSVTLNAEDDIKLLAAKNTADQHSTNSSKSGSIGVNIGTGGVGVSVAASKGRGNADGSDVTWTNTQVNAGQQVSLNSGGDTTLQGAVVAAPQITANIQGNLTIESLQDTSKFDSKQSSLGGSLTIGAGAGGSINASKSNTNSDYASVTEQSGLKAGDQGFNVNVAKNTDLKGGVISSTGQAMLDGKNSLTTATLTQGDVQNHSNASATSSGINLSSDMLTQGKYGLAKAVVGNGLNNSKESDASTGVTRSAIQGATVTITDDATQQALTGKTAAQTVASLNTDTANAQTAARKLDLQAMERTVQAERAIKEAVIAEAFKLSDEAYRKIFIKTSIVIALETDPETGKPISRHLSETEKQNLKPAEDGKIHVSTNGIFNDEEAAAKYAIQHNPVQGPQYLVYFLKANNIISELMVAAYQKYLENDTFGLSTTTEEIKHLSDQYGQTGLQLDGHSRGSMTIGNALESQAKNDQSQGSLSQTTVSFFGPAYNAQKADGLLSFLQNRSAMDDMQAQIDSVLKLQNHAADPVGTIIGGNPATGGTIPEGSTKMTEMIRAATGQEYTTHNCYQSTAPNCQAFWKDQPTTGTEK
ncbi:hemagglutinin repeat-containing protein [Rhodoferax sp. 4810]|nr:hemagglutinin repeat-containing protein [Rhodoferax jenense]